MSDESEIYIQTLDIRDLESRAKRAATFDVPVGTAVPGSRFVRSYCSSCGAAIRVGRPTCGDRCESCVPRRVQRPREPGIKERQVLLEGV